MSKIELTQVSKSYGETKVLSQITMTINEGEMISLVGPSGSGKTTILRLIAGLTDINSGKILINDQDISRMTQKENGAVIVYQDYALFPHMTVYENITFGLKIRKVSKRIQEKTVDDLLELLHMEGYHKRYPSELSGGQKQRVAIARALAIQPKVLLLDEPFSSLDRHLRDAMRQLIKELQNKMAITTILVTHDIEEALMVSDRISVLLDGQVAQLGPPKNVYEVPASKAVADFLGHKNIQRFTLDQGLIKTPFADIKIESTYEGAVDLLYHHDALEINSEQNGLEGVIKDATYTGRVLILNVSTREGEFDILQDVGSSFKEGDKIYLNLNVDNITLYRSDTGGLL